ncbi:hypothetical protein AAHE18_06G265000 [Arachis hypogaea]
MGKILKLMVMMMMSCRGLEVFESEEKGRRVEMEGSVDNSCKRRRRRGRRESGEG